jgi:hypothetical protein
MRRAPLAGLALVAALGQAPAVVLPGADLRDEHEQVPGGVGAEREWFGLFTTRSKPGDASSPARVAPVRLRIARRERGVRVDPSPADPVFIVSRIRGITPGPAVTSVVDVDLRPDASQIDLDLGPRVYRVALRTREPGQCDAIVTLVGNGVTQTLFDARSADLPYGCDDPHFHIHWAGDLDRDGRLDLVVTLSRKYSYYPRQLLLSSAAQDGELVAEVARYDRLAR